MSSVAERHRTRPHNCRVLRRRGGRRERAERAPAPASRSLVHRSADGFIRFVSFEFCNAMCPQASDFLNTQGRFFDASPRTYDPSERLSTNSKRVSHGLHYASLLDLGARGNGSCRQRTRRKRVEDALLHEPMLLRRQHALRQRVVQLA